jgi:hypothetical protein
VWISRAMSRGQGSRFVGRLVGENVKGFGDWDVVGARGMGGRVEVRRWVIGSWRMMNGFRERGVVGLVGCGGEMRRSRIDSGVSGGLTPGIVRKMRRYSLN